jgi:hypothetical protein
MLIFVKFNPIVHFVIYIFISILLPVHSHAAMTDVTDEEKALVSPFCADTEAFGGRPQCLTGRSSGAENWHRILGDGFCHVHHYCWAQVKLMRANHRGLSSDTRKLRYSYVVGEYEYVIRNAPPDFVLLPEIYTRLGDVKLLIDKARDAEAAYLKARQLRPDYWPAYSRWIDYLIKTNKKEDAKNLALEGIKFSPESKVLKEQYRKLGGNLIDLEYKVQTSQPKEAAAEVPSPEK